MFILYDLLVMHDMHDKTNKSCRRTARLTASGPCQTLGQTRLVTQSIIIINLFALMLYKANLLTHEIR